jgi:hypothetical protein
MPKLFNSANAEPKWIGARRGERLYNSQKRWTAPESGCSVLRMGKMLAALLVFSTAALAQENPTAYDALRVVGTKLNREYVNHVISVTGVNGNPQPETWKILVEDAHARGGVREVEVANGNIVSERTPVRTVVGSTEGATINTTRLNLDSSGAYAVASHTADKSNTRFATVSYTLRTDERGDPIWVVTLHDNSRRPVGTIHINCNRGNVVRTEGLFAGTTMTDVVTDREADESTDEETGPFHEARARIRETFRHARDDARDTFDRVRSSFVDFINRR